MNYIATEDQVIFTATKEETAVLEIWINCKPEDILPPDIVGGPLDIWCGKNKRGEVNYIMKGAIICAPSDNDNADIVHQIPVKAGDEIIASFPKENTLRYEVSDYDTWYAKERKKIEDKINGVGR